MNRRLQGALSSRRQQGIKTETRILAKLHYGKTYTPSEIARKTGLTRSCIYPAIGRMAKKGYIDLDRNSPKIIIKPKPLEELVEALERAEKDPKNDC